MAMHFLRPLWLLAFIPASLYLAWVIYTYHTHNPWKKVCDPHLLAVLLQKHSKKSRLFFNTALSLFFIICITALAGPTWKKTQLPIFRDINSIMVVLDLSETMLLDDLKPNRLTRAKFKIQDLIQKAQNTQMGLVVFTQEAFVVSPLSQDANTLNALLDELHPHMMPILGSDAGAGLDEALHLLKQARVSNGDVLLVTSNEPSANSFTAAKQVAQSGSRLNVLAIVDSNVGTQSIISKLRSLAEIGNGELFLFTPDTKDIQSILNNQLDRKTVKEEKSEGVNFWEDAGPIFCLALIPFALLVLRERLRQ